MEKIETVLKVTLTSTQKEYIGKIYNSEKLVQLPIILRNPVKIMLCMILLGLVIHLSTLWIFYIVSLLMAIFTILNLLSIGFISPENYKKILTVQGKTVLDVALFNKHSFGLRKFGDGESISAIILGIISFNIGYYFFIPLAIAYLLSFVVLKVTVREAMIERIKLL